MTNKELQKTWEARVSAFKTSGLSTKEWCQEHELKINQLRYWIRKFRDAEASDTRTPQWLSVEIGEPVASDKDGLPIRIGKATIEVKPGFNPVLLTEVVKALSALC